MPKTTNKIPMRVLVVALSLAFTAGSAHADMPDARAELMAKIREKALQLRVARVGERLELDTGKRKQLEALLRKHDAGRLALRRERHNLRRMMRRVPEGDEKKAGELFDKLMAHKRKNLELEIARAGELRQLLGANKGLRAVVILTRVERRIEARMRTAMKKRRAKKRDR